MESTYPLPLVLVGIETRHISAVRGELSHAETEVESEYPSPEAMLECLRRSKERPRLLIVQMGEECDDLAVERLSGYFAGWPIMALMPGDGTLEEIQRVYRAGARQVVELPLEREDFRRALTRIASQVDRVASGRHVFAVAGVTGGCGATTMAINLAYEIANQFQRPTVLAELTLQVGAFASMLDIHSQITLPYLLREIHRVDDLLIEKALVSYEEGLKVLAGAVQVGPIPQAELTHVSKIIEGLKKLADVTVLDVPGTFNDADLGVLYAADYVVLVALQNVPSIRTLKLFCEMFPEERLNHSLWVAINRYDPQLKGYTCAELREVLKTPNLVPISNDYRAVNRAINQGQPLRKAAPETRILRDLDELIHALLGLEKESSRERRGLLGRIVHAMHL
jgi:pilus assembly protein CpaE